MGGARLIRRDSLLFAPAAAALLAALVVGTTRASTPQFASFDLGTLGGTTSLGQAVNDEDEVVGSSTTASGAEHAFLWTQAGGMIDLGTLGGTTSGASGVTDAGQVFGTSTTATGESHAFLWTREGGMIDLGTLGGTSSRPWVANGRGDVAGTSTTSSGDAHAFLWTPSGGMTDLGPGWAWDVNNHRQVVGNTGASGHAFSWTPSGGTVDLGPGDAFAVTESGQVFGVSGSGLFSWTRSGGKVELVDLGSRRVLRVNHLGEAAGTSGTSPGQAFFWSAASGFVDIADSVSGIWGMNDAGQVVMTPYAPVTKHPATWTPEGGLVDLVGPDGQIAYGFPSGVNDAGDISGYLRTGSGDLHAMLWRLQGSFSICMAAAGGASGGSFGFTVTSLATGATQTIGVDGGSCSAPVTGEAGRYKIAEDLTSGLWNDTGATAVPSGAVLGESATAGWIKVGVTGGAQTQVTFTNAPAPASLTVCTWSKTKALRGSSFAFAVGSQTVTAVARTKVSPGCSSTLTIQPGSKLTVTESVPAGERVASIAAGGSLAITSSGGGAATVTIGPRANRITFENEPVPPG